MRKTKIGLIFAFLFLLLLQSSIVFAEGKEAPKRSIMKFENISINENQTVRNVIVAGGDVDISGKVLDTVIVINGNLKIEDTAKVEGLVFVLGGNITQEPGSKVTDDLFNITFNDDTKNSLLVGGLLTIGAWMFRLILSLLFITLPVLTAMMARRRLDIFVTNIQDSPKRLITIGAVSGIMLTAISLLLILTIIGIPLVIILLFVTFAFFLIGLAATSIIIGEWFPGRAERSNWITTIGGSFALTAAINVPFFGWFILLMLFWMSLGLMTTWFWDKWKKRKIKKR